MVELEWGNLRQNHFGVGGLQPKLKNTWNSLTKLKAGAAELGTQGANLRTQYLGHE